MRNLYKAELVKFRSSLSLWVALGVMTLCAGLATATGIYSSAENAFLSLSNDIMIVALACAIYSGLSVTDDFSNGMIRRCVAGGHKRTTIIMSKFLHYIFGCIVI